MPTKMALFYAEPRLTGYEELFVEESDIEMKAARDNRLRRLVSKVAKGISIALAGGLLLPSTGNLMEPVKRQAPDPTQLGNGRQDIMSANVHGWKSPGGSSNVDDVMAVIKARRPDVGCLQEVYSGEGDAFQKLQDIGYGIIFVPTVVIPGKGVRGNAVISPHDMALEGVEILRKPIIGEERSAMTVLIGGIRGFRVRNSHLSTPDHQAQAELEKLGRDADNTAVDCGDMNMGAEQIANTLLGQAYGIMSGGGNTLATFPAWDPKRSIDQIMSTCAEAPSIEDIRSDHKALFMSVGSIICQG